MNLAKIIEGVRNSIAPPKSLREFINKTAEERLAICIGCEYNSTQGEIKNFSQCTACGCFLKLKTKCLSCNCGLEDLNIPLKWQAVASEAEDIEIETYLKDRD